MQRITAIILLFLCISCEQDIDINIPNREPQLIVEGYINTELTIYNYVRLSRTLDYFDPAFENAGVSGAIVTITEGETLADHTIRWDTTTRVRLREAEIPVFDTTLVPGLYFDPRIFTDPANALRGRVGKQYLLEITDGGNHYSATTAILPAITIDSLTSGYYFNDDDDPRYPRARLTVHYQDPDTIGDAYRYFWRTRVNRLSLGWGALGNDRFVNATDELTNGQYIDLTHSGTFEIGDTVDYYLAHVERKVYDFWDSYNAARANGGPFSTPVSLRSTIAGNNVIGSFSGYSISYRRVIVR